MSQRFRGLPLTGTQQPDATAMILLLNCRHSRIICCLVFHVTLVQIPSGTHTITVTLQECKLILDHVMGNVSLMFSSTDQKLTVKTTGYQILKSHQSQNTQVERLRDNRTDLCFQLTDKAAACFNVGCVQEAKVFLQSTNE